MNDGLRSGAVELLEDLLRRAKAGEIESVAIAYRGEENGTAFDAKSMGELEGVLGLVGVLQLRIAESISNAARYLEDPRAPA